VGPVKTIARSSPHVNEYHFPEVTFMNEQLAVWTVSFAYTSGMALHFCCPFLLPSPGIPASPQPGK